MDVALKLLSSFQRGGIGEEYSWRDTAGAQVLPELKELVQELARICAEVEGASFVLKQHDQSCHFFYINRTVDTSGRVHLVAEIYLVFPRIETHLFPRLLEKVTQAKRTLQSLHEWQASIEPITFEQKDMVWEAVLDRLWNDKSVYVPKPASATALLQILGDDAFSWIGFFNTKRPANISMKPGIVLCNPDFAPKCEFQPSYVNKLKAFSKTFPKSPLFRMMLRKNETVRRWALKDLWAHTASDSGMFLWKIRHEVLLTFFERSANNETQPAMHDSIKLHNPTMLSSSEVQMKIETPIIGIDFGTSISKMSWFNKETGRAEVLHNAEGDDRTPSVVYYSEHGTLVGKAAEVAMEDADQLDEESRRIALQQFVRSCKRRLDDSTPIHVGRGRMVLATEVAAEILRKLKVDAETGHFNAPVEKAVITHPAIFTPKQREALRESAKLAGFVEIHLLEEPVAAALAYAAVGQNVGNGLLVYDLGGGTFDLALVARGEDSVWKLGLPTDGDFYCGGDDVDQDLYDYWNRQVFETLGRNVSTNNQIDLGFLRECRKRKENLSLLEADAGARVFQSRLPWGATAKLSMDRATFDGLVAPRVEITLRKTRDMLRRAGERNIVVDNVVLIGGASRLPLIGEKLANELPVVPRAWGQKDVAVSLGAAIWGSLGASTHLAQLPENQTVIATQNRPTNVSVESLSQLIAAKTSPFEMAATAYSISQSLLASPEDSMATNARVSLTKYLIDYCKSQATTITDVLEKARSYELIAFMQGRIEDDLQAIRSLDLAEALSASLKVLNSDKKLRYLCIAYAKAAAGAVLTQTSTWTDAPGPDYSDNFNEHTRNASMVDVETICRGFQNGIDSLGKNGWSRRDYLKFIKSFLDHVSKVATLSQRTEQTIYRFIRRLESRSDENFVNETMSIITTQSRVGDIAGAKATASSLSNEDEQVQAYEIIAEQQLRHGEIAAFAEWAAGFDSAKWRIAICSGMVNFLFDEDV